MNLCQLIELASKNMVLQQWIRLHLVLYHIIHPPTQLQGFSNTFVSLPKKSKGTGGQSYPEWDEVEKKLKANFAARRQKQIEKELAQIKEALPIGSINEKKDDSEHESASIEKAESSSIYFESIKSNEASIIEKGQA